MLFPSHVRDRIAFVLRFVGLRALLGGLLALGALRWSVGPIEYLWARVYSCLDPRSTYVYGTSSVPPATTGATPHAVEVRIPTRLSRSEPRIAPVHLRVFTVECTGVPIIGAVAPLLVTRWRLVPILVGVLGAAALTSTVNLLRLWLDYRLMSPHLPYLDMHQWVSTSLFGLEVVGCALFCFREGWVRWR